MEVEVGELASVETRTRVMAPASFISEDDLQPFLG